MPQKISVKLPIEAVNDAEILKKAIASKLKINPKNIQDFQILKQSIDARKRPILFELQVNVFLKGDVYFDAFSFEPKWKNVSNRPPVYIAGCGPAGLFAALKLIELNLKPIIIERGKDVQERRRDLAAMNKDGIVNPNSNYCFGEGGAGTYSDGKLYTRSGKRGSILECLQLFHLFGADSNILIKAHPHIGTNKLPKIISNMRDHIISCGGEVRFNSNLTNVNYSFDQLKEIEINGSETIPCNQLILATGHSARDIFKLLNRKNILIEAKPFALGVRIEHPQDLINEIQYKCQPNDPILDTLGAASYSLVSQENNRGVFSFCMCPGGIIAPASTEEGALVVNGWSPSKRNGKFANSGMVVSVNESDFNKYGFIGPLSGMKFQEMVEKYSWKAGGGNLVAPAQRMTDFVQNKLSNQLPECSYLPGVRSVLLSEVLPPEIYQSLKNGFYSFSSKMHGYLTSEAIITATESRTSSPVKIPRDKDTLEHLQVKGLYPCAEGAGYAGGIISAAIDGIRIAEQIALKKFS